MASTIAAMMMSIKGAKFDKNINVYIFRVIYILEIVYLIFIAFCETDRNIIALLIDAVDKNLII